MRKAISIVMVLMLLLALAAPVFAIARPSFTGSTTLNTLEKYEEFFSKYYIKDDGFVPYSDLRAFGEFVEFDTNAGPGFIWSELSYRYTLKDANGFVYELAVYCYEKAEEIKGSSMHVGWMFENGHLGQRTSTTSGLYKRDEIGYSYDKTGALYQIDWNVGTYRVSISAESGKTFADYPVDGEPTFVSRLFSLDADEAAAARQELDSLIPMPKPESPWPYVIMAVCVAGVVALAIVCHIRRKKRIREIIRSQITA